MGETATNSTEISKSPKKSFFKGIKSEFKKISWTDKATLCKQTVAVVLSTAGLCVIISVLDYLIRTAINFIV